MERGLQTHKREQKLRKTSIKRGRLVMMECEWENPWERRRKRGGGQGIEKALSKQMKRWWETDHMELRWKYTDIWKAFQGSLKLLITFFGQEVLKACRGRGGWVDCGEGRTY